MRKVLKSIDKPLFFISILLFAFGLVMIFSASNVTAYMKYSASPYNYFLKQFIFLVGSFILATFVIRVESKYYRGWFRFFMLVVIGALVYLLLYGTIKNQAISWIDFGFFSIQPSEFAKVLVIGYLATYYEKRKDKLDKFTTCFLPLIIPVIIALLIFRQPDLGTTILFTLIVAFIFFIVPISKKIKNKVIFLVLGVIICITLVFIGNGESLLEDRQSSRFDFFNPCSKEKFYGSGNQVCNGYIAINNGGLFGLGLGNSTQKYLYLPEAHTDFIFPIIIEEVGLIGAALIFVLYFLLIGRIIKIGRDSYTFRGAVICYGVAFYISLQILVNLGGVLGLMPMTGVPLPFLSYGGSFALCLVMALTLVQRINVETKLEEEKFKKK